MSPARISPVALFTSHTAEVAATEATFPFDRAGGELLFNAIAQRYERRSVLVTTNLAFSEWPKVFGGDEKLTTALLDRLAHHAAVITTKGKSFRMRRRSDPAEEASNKTAKQSKNR